VTLYYEQKSGKFNLERTLDSSVESKSKRHKPDGESSDLQPVSSQILLSSDIENKVAAAVETKLGELKSMMSKVYALQKRTSVQSKVEYSIEFI
jgi:hypothetical protein